MNCISWIVGHLANQEHRLLGAIGPGPDLAPGLNELVGFGQPASTPPLDEMWAPGVRSPGPPTDSWIP